MTLSPEIDFVAIRPCRGTRHGGFEELSVQLLRSGFSDEVEVVRVEGAGGDGGVEAFVVLPGGGEIGLQAKFFSSLGAKQWEQISQSVISALDTRHALAEYRVAVPLDRTPTQKKKWDALVIQWQTLAKKKGFRRRIRFVWWGASELRDFLTTPAHGAKLHYWFGCRQYSEDWLSRHTQAAIADLDCRYTPAHHVRTRSEALVDAFSLTESFIAEFYQHVKAVFDAGRKLNESVGAEKLKDAAPADWESFTAVVQTASGKFGSGKQLPSFHTIRGPLTTLTDACENLIIKLEKLNRPSKPFADFEERARYQGPFSWTLNLANRLETKLRSLRGFLTQYACADCRHVLVVGPAGSGKSHLLANAVLQARARGQPSLLLLGEYFLSSNEPWTQVLEKTGWESNASELLAALNQAAETCDRPALLCIDAINESTERSLWRSHLNSFAKRIEPFPHVRLIVSCRNDFVGLTLPESLAKRTDNSWAVIDHEGYGDKLFGAVAKYFSGYGIQADHFPPLLEEFQNPLFLKTFCEAFENSSIPRGPITLDAVMKQRVSKICEKLLRDIDCPKEVTRRAIELVAEAVQANHGQPVLREELRPKIDTLFSGRGDSQSLYRHLKSNGVLVEIGQGYTELDPEARVVVRFPYERFSDYFIADRMLSGYTSPQSLKSGWVTDGTLKLINERSAFWRLRGLMRTMAVLLPERFGIEVAELVTNKELSREVCEDFLASLPWRSRKSFGKESHALFRASQSLGSEQFLQSLLRIATIPDHPYNADYLHERLNSMEVARRDELWTKEISSLTLPGGDVPDLLVQWAFQVRPELVSREQALLVGHVLAWFFSSNHRAFRLRATLAAIRILLGRCEETAQLVRNFHSCNDLYVVDRVYAVACGVAMREGNLEALRILARAVYDTVFAGEHVTAHVMVRDYARCVLELAASRGCLPPGVDAKKFRPPYSSKWPQIWSEAKVETFERTEGWHEIRHSVQPECTGMYGDFGRYVMQSCVHQFSNMPVRRKFERESGAVAFDAMTARRWILQRVKQLGWTPERFQKYENALPWKGRQRVDVEELRAERISKKYQWIALRELQAYLSDHYYRALDWHEDKPRAFEGAWELWARDFDPSQPLHDLPNEETRDPDDLPPKQRPWWSQYPDPFADARLVANRESWVIAKPGDFHTLIELVKPPQIKREFLALAGYYDWKETLPYDKGEREYGNLKMFTHLRSWLVQRKDLKRFLALVQALHFWGEGCQLTELGRGWFGEYPWGDSHRNVKHGCEQRDPWLKRVQIHAVQTVCHYGEDIAAIIPSPQLCNILHARWAGNDFDFVNQTGTIVAGSSFLGRGFGSAPCIVSRPELIQCLKRTGWEIVWGLVGERHCWSSEAGEHIVPKDCQFSGVYWLDEGGLEGGITKHVVLDIPRRARKGERPV